MNPTKPPEIPPPRPSRTAIMAWAQRAAGVAGVVVVAAACMVVLTASIAVPAGADIEYRVCPPPPALASSLGGCLAALLPGRCSPASLASVVAAPAHASIRRRMRKAVSDARCGWWQARALSAAQRMDPRAVALLQASPGLRAAFERAKHNRGARVALKQQLTILCDEGRSHPEYWSLKSELDNLDGGEDDSDVLDEDGTFDDMSFGDSLNLDDKLHSMSFGSGSSALSFDSGMGDTFSDNDIIQDW